MTASDPLRGSGRNPPQAHALCDQVMRECRSAWREADQIGPHAVGAGGWRACATRSGTGSSSSSSDPAVPATRKGRPTKEPPLGVSFRGGSYRHRNRHRVDVTMTFVQHVEQGLAIREPADSKLIVPRVRQAHRLAARCR